MDFYSTYVTTMLLPVGALALCGTMWCVQALHVSWLVWLRFSPVRVAYCFVFEKVLSRERHVPLVLAGRVILPAASAMTDEQKDTKLHAFKIRCVSVVTGSTGRSRRASVILISA